MPESLFEFVSNLISEHPQIDVDGDGQISLTEFKGLVKTLEKERGGLRPKVVNQSQVKRGSVSRSLRAHEMAWTEDYLLLFIRIIISPFVLQLCFMLQQFSWPCYLAPWHLLASLSSCIHAVLPSV